MIALSTFSRYNGSTPLGGVIGLLGYQPLPQENFSNFWQHKTPLLLYNGAADKISPAIFVKDTFLYFDKEYK